MSSYQIVPCDCLVDATGAVVGILGADGRQWSFPAAPTIGVEGAVFVHPAVEVLFDGTNTPQGFLVHGQEFIFASAFTLNTNPAVKIRHRSLLISSSGQPQGVRGETGAFLFPVPPTPSVLAFITGTLSPGNVLTANVAVGITATSWQWQLNGTNIAGQTAQTYTVLTTDPGNVITVQINAGAYAASVSIPAILPVFSAAPAVTSATTSAPVAWTVGTFSTAGMPTPTLVFNVFDNGTLVAANATSGVTYTPTVVGHTITVQEVATNSGGSVSSTSAGVAVTATVALRAAAATNLGPQGFQLSLVVNAATSTGTFFRIPFTVGAAIPGIVALFPNWALVPLAGVSNPGNSFTITAFAVEVGSTTVVGSFGGSASAVVANGANQLSDVVSAASLGLGSSIPQGTQGFFRFNLQFATSATDKCAHMGSVVGAGGQGTIYDVTKVSLVNGISGTGAITYSMINGGVNGTDAKNEGFYYKPILLGSHTNAATGFWGDSKTYGTQDTIVSASGAFGMNRCLYPDPTTPVGAKSGINFGCPSGIAVDCTTAVGAASLTSLTSLYQYINHAVVGYGTNAVTQSAQTALYAQIRAAGIPNIIQRSLTPRTTTTVSISSLTSTGTACTAIVADTSGLQAGQSYPIAGATPAAYNGTFAITVVDATHFTYTAGSAPGSSATGTITLNDQWRTSLYQTQKTGFPTWGVGSDAQTFETFLKGIVTTDANMTYYQSYGERMGTTGTNYWLWLNDGAALFGTLDGLHENPLTYELNIGTNGGTTGTATTQAGGTVSTSLRTLVQAFV